MAGLYIILEYIRNAFRIDLLPLIRIYLVISINKLYKAANNPLPGQL
jgi:adenosine/AMP kinase